MSQPGTFDRVYAAIKQRLRDGVYRPGDRLEPAALAEDLNASVTPIRDALHRLTGERLVEAPRHEGFRVPMLTETTLRHLYRWHLDLILLAIANRRSSPQPADDPFAAMAQDSEARHRQNALFLAIARMTRNPEHVLAIEGLRNRLEPVRRLETLLLDAVDEETREILAALQANDRRALRRALVRYHRRRAGIVPELLERLQEG